jgi:hypothetical protein
MWPEQANEEQAMNGTAMLRAAARLAMTAGTVLLPLMNGCGSGAYPEQAGSGGGSPGGGSGTLLQLVLSPSAITLAPSGTVQFTVSGTLSDGSSNVPNVTYTVTAGTGTHGTITSGGLYSAGATVGTDSVIATQLGGVTGVPPCCADTSVVTVTLNPPTALAMVAQPGGAVSGTVFTQQPVVELQDALHRLVTQSGVVVTASIASGAGTLGGTTTVSTDGQGQAVFSGLFITGTGTFTLAFTSPGLTAVTSATLTVTP